MRRAFGIYRLFSLRRKGMCTQAERIEFPRPPRLIAFSRSVAAISCGQPPQVENADVDLINRSTTWNSIAVYSCKAGYYLPHGSKFSVLCLESGVWESVNVTCLQDDESKHQLAVKSRDEFRSGSTGNGESRSLHVIVLAGILSSLLLTVTVAVTLICR